MVVVLKFSISAAFQTKWPVKIVQSHIRLFQRSCQTRVYPQIFQILGHFPYNDYVIYSIISHVSGNVHYVDCRFIFTIFNLITAL